MEASLLNVSRFFLRNHDVSGDSISSSKVVVLEGPGLSPELPHQVNPLSPDLFPLHPCCLSLPIDRLLSPLFSLFLPLGLPLVLFQLMLLLKSEFITVSYPPMMVIDREGMLLSWCFQV
ncbi:hypothetical protein V6N13_011653 [Hibiscus sabdariffa]|uniref:Uncharacterized protein n=1 Tax=Hibiscus sabdariffa TaxID=183260 RepID=A0ABR2SCW4_9ROSI